MTDAGVELSQAEFGAFFYNVRRDDGEAYTLYTLAGAPRAAFETFPMPRNTAVFERTFRGGPPVVEDEIMIQMLAAEYLEECGFTVDAAGSAAEAMNKLGLVPGGVDVATAFVLTSTSPNARCASLLDRQPGPARLTDSLIIRLQ